MGRSMMEKQQKSNISSFSFLDIHTKKVTHSFQPPINIYCQIGYSGLTKLKKMINVQNRLLSRG